MFAIEADVFHAPSNERQDAAAELNRAHQVDEEAHQPGDQAGEAQARKIRAEGDYGESCQPNVFVTGSG